MVSKHIQANATQHENVIEFSLTVPTKDQKNEDPDGKFLLVIPEGKASTEHGTKLKTAKDDVTILIPQPSDNPEDPLNWTSFKKHSILLCVAFGAFLGDFGLLSPIPATAIQSEEWHLSLTKANYPTNISTAMVGLSSLLWLPFQNAWGRMPVLFWSTFLGFFFTLGAALAPNYSVFYALRALQGLVQGTGSATFLAYIHDLFFFHQQARKIGIFYSVFIISPFAGPLVGSFMVGYLGNWRPVFWLVFACAGTLLCAILLFGDESYYNRSRAAEEQPPRKPGLQRLSRVVGLWQLQQRKGNFEGLSESYVRLGRVIFKPVIPIALFVFGACIMWQIGINNSSAILLLTPQAHGGYGLTRKNVGFFYLIPITAVLIGEGIGHFLNDWLVRRYARRHQNCVVAEARLWTCYLGGALMVPGLILVGQTLGHHLSYAGLIFGWGMHGVGVMLISVAIAAYVLDCSPSVAGEASAWLNFIRAFMGFPVPYFQAEWGSKQGYDVTFALQAVITFTAILCVVALHLYGHRIRQWEVPIQLLRV